MNLKELRRELHKWGRFWAHQERPVGFNRSSMCSAMIETVKTGIFTQRGYDRQFGSSERILVPGWIEKLDSLIEKLPVQQKRAITLRYIKNTQLGTSEKLALLNAEIEIMVNFGN
jgi:hypothetical protein